MLVQDQNYLGFEAVRQRWWLLCWTHFPSLKASMITQIQICSYAGLSLLFNACCLLLFYHGLWPELPPQYLSMGSFHSFGKKSFKFSYLPSLLFPFISIKLVFNCKHSPQDSSHTLYWHEITTKGKLAIYQPAKAFLHKPTPSIMKFSTFFNSLSFSWGGYTTGKICDPLNLSGSGSAP